MLLLTDIKRCPACGRVNSLRWDQRVCSGCKARVFRPDDNWPLIKAEWILSGWVFFSPVSAGNFRGWVNQPHLDNPQPVLEVKTEKPSNKYNSVSRTPGASSDYSPAQLGMETYKS